VRLHTTYAQEGDEYDEPPEDPGLRLPARPGTVDSGRPADPTRHPGARRRSDIVDADVVAQHPPAQTIVQQQIPQPRSATELAVRVKGPRAALPSADEVAAEELSAAVSAGGLAGMLFVSDPERSLHFYTEMLGFTIVYTTPSSTMLEYQGARILLLRKADFSGVNSRSVFLLITVPDVDSAYHDLVAKGVAFSHRPKEVSRGNDEVTLVAAFRDPDGHGVALTEWRRRRG
jgi:catechol 2,3-dioxygenase-like lactoylglutathione lyase family enzyme